MLPGVGKRTILYTCVHGHTWDAEDAEVVNDPNEMNVEQWTQRRPEEVGLLAAFTKRMRTELASNAHKGDRPGWLSAGSREMVAEVLYHAAKLSYALRQAEQGDGDPDKVLEFAADVGNCAMMVADCAGVLEG